MKNLAILQARMGSSRLPGKVLREINSFPMIYWQLKRIEQSTYLDRIIVATSNDPSDDVLCNFLAKEGFNYYRGSLTNVFSRFSDLNSTFQPINIIRLTADCPLIMPRMIDDMLEEFESSQFDYFSNSVTPTFPDGLDIEIFTSYALKRLEAAELTQDELEHVTLGFLSRRNDFRIANFANDIDLANLRWTVDYDDDLRFVRDVFETFKGRELVFGTSDVLDEIKQGHIVPATTQNIPRNPERNFHEI